MFPGNYCAILQGSSHGGDIQYAAVKTELFTTTESSAKTSNWKMNDAGIAVTVRLLDPSGQGLANYNIIAHENNYSNILQNDMFGIARTESDSDGVATLLLIVS